MVEPSPLGTAGAIRFARGALRSDPVLDHEWRQLHRRRSLRFRRPPPRRQRASAPCCALKSTMPAATGASNSTKAAAFSGFVEKDAAFHGRALINAGVYLLSGGLLDDIAAGDAASIERDVFERLPSGSLAAFAGRFRFIDIGTPESLAHAARCL